VEARLVDLSLVIGFGPFMDGEVDGQTRSSVGSTWTGRFFLFSVDPFNRVLPNCSASKPVLSTN
jgi:hypothetical protein